jgi:hypothetical protein
MTQSIAEAVAADLRARSELGVRKYGVSLGNAPLTQQQTVQHAYEESLDLASYLKRLLTEIARDKETIAALEVVVLRGENARRALVEELKAVAKTGHVVSLPLEALSAASNEGCATPTPPTTEKPLAGLL